MTDVMPGSGVIGFPDLFRSEPDKVYFKMETVLGKLE